MQSPPPVSPYRIQEGSLDDDVKNFLVLSLLAETPRPIITANTIETFHLSDNDEVRQMKLNGYVPQENILLPIFMYPLMESTR